MKKIFLIWLSSTLIVKAQEYRKVLIPMSISYNSILKDNVHEIGIDFPIDASKGFYFTPGVSVMYINSKFQSQDKKGIINFSFKPTFYSDVNDFIKLFFQINSHIGFFKGNENKNVVLSSGIGLNSGLQVHKISFSIGYRYIYQYANADSSQDIGGLHIGLGYMLF